MNKDKLYTCNIEEPTEHCLSVCPCGKAHRPDMCTIIEYCGIVDKEVHCIPVTKNKPILNKE